mmetsp:Transcript_31108/g.82795  ORF Transcript_31108/g.82795 Transcript_31108/m.82795 type:complete len:87 (+) Transcript_31108:146-406(+)
MRGYEDNPARQALKNQGGLERIRGDDDAACLKHRQRHNFFDNLGTLPRNCIGSAEHLLPALSMGASLTESLQTAQKQSLSRLAVHT